MDDTEVEEIVVYNIIVNDGINHIFASYTSFNKEHKNVAFGLLKPHILWKFINITPKRFFRSFLISLLSLNGSVFHIHLLRKDYPNFLAFTAPFFPWFGLIIHIQPPPFSSQVLVNQIGRDFLFQGSETTNNCNWPKMDPVFWWSVFLLSVLRLRLCEYVYVYVNMYRKGFQALVEMNLWVKRFSKF